jgi:YggT family protein
MGALDRIMEPLYRPIRKILPDFGGVDFSPLVLLLVIQILRMLLQGVAVDVAYPAA